MQFHRIPEPRQLNMKGMNPMFTLPADRRNDLLAHARSFVNADMPYSFTPHEQRALQSFFTNLNRRVFFMHTLPANIGATLGAMYSRMKNPRGIRGVFVDNFLPALLAGMIPEVQDRYDGDGMRFLKDRKVISLDSFIFATSGTANLFWDFCKKVHVDPNHLAQLTDSRKTKGFLNTYLDQYGHNSIARVGSVWLCMENISILAAKSVEWSRPGTGYIELSTRYVNMDGKDTYPIAEEMAIVGDNPSIATQLLAACFRAYASLLGNADLDGPFPKFLRARYADLYENSSGDLTTGIAGETYDVLGNFLPAATLTSVFSAISGEALPSVLKHLVLDGTPENIALAETILAESEKIGANQFCKRLEPTPAEQIGWNYLATTSFPEDADDISISLLENDVTGDLMRLTSIFGIKDGFTEYRTMEDIAQQLFSEKRGDYDKLPREFETTILNFLGKMSFRGWRDLHRQSLATHRRTRLTPYLGFYRYDKPHCREWDMVRGSIIEDARAAYAKLQQVPLFMRQYVLPLGFNVGFLFACNMREFEFCAWQRSKWSVNHEVRQVFLAMEQEMRKAYHPWWLLFSRADMTPAYVFARGKKPAPLEML